MLIDNKKNIYGDGDAITTVWNFIDLNIFREKPKAKFDIVTGYFTLRALSRLYQTIPPDVEYRIISSELVKDEKNEQHVVDLLRGDEGIENTFPLNQYVRDARAFLLRDSVKCKVVLNSFCHAKLYLYKPEVRNVKSFFILGSSNLTDAGLGLRETSNVELNMAKAADKSDSDYRELEVWFKKLWEAASDTIPTDPTDRKSKKIGVKEFFIQQIDAFYRKYTPEEVYYKILFELFNFDLDLESSIEHKQDMSLLQTSSIWKTLFNYQQKGVISLIKILRKYNGAILADAVGLGKTFSALAVVKYFQTRNYTTVVICPKKLENNWTQYLRRHGSRFEHDEFDYLVRFHTDFQCERLEDNYDDAPLSWLQRQKKVLLVIDESHNLRNEKSSRYQELLNSLIKNHGQEKRDVKLLLLSATPINTGLSDVKGQFNLIAHGEDGIFNNEEFGIESLRSLFATAQAHYTRWCKNPERTISGFIKVLPSKFFNLTDKLIVARTRKLIEKTLGEDIGFPNKEKPLNIYQGLDHFGIFNSTEDIYKEIEKILFAAYQPSLFMEESRKKSKKVSAAEGWKNDEVNRERYLAKMMGILFLKRLESSWFSLLTTVKNVLMFHEETLDRVKNFQNSKTDGVIPTLPFSDDDENGADIEDNFTLRNGEIKLSDMKNIGGFQKALAKDVNLLKGIYEGLLDFKERYEVGLEKDVKLNKLERILKAKQKQHNRKVVIFTAYADTAKFIYDELIKRGFTNIASVSGSSCYCTGSQINDGYISILRRFAPYSKLYKELDWQELYEKANLSRGKYFNDTENKWDVSYEDWVKLVKKFEPKYDALLQEPIDILIATDCLSEGQNLQDADMQINYDIHWNPVRLIQRFGRIDRIGSPNNIIQCVNFWPAKSFEDYLQLEARVQNRMAVMTLVGSEPQELNETYRKMVEDNPIQDKNADKLLQELQNNSISDIESSQTLTLKDFSFESFRQDLVDYFEKNKEVFRRMPNGIFSGFELEEKDRSRQKDSLVALIGYPHREEGSKKRYKELYLVALPIEEQEENEFMLNKAEILELLRSNRYHERFVPQWIDNSEPDRLKQLSYVLNDWLRAQSPKKATKNLAEMLKSRRGNMARKLKDAGDFSQDKKFQINNFDLIVWEYISSSREVNKS